MTALRLHFNEPPLLCWGIKESPRRFKAGQEAYGAAGELPTKDQRLLAKFWSPARCLASVEVTAEGRPLLALNTSLQRTRALNLLQELASLSSWGTSPWARRVQATFGVKRWHSGIHVLLENSARDGTDALLQECFQDLMTHCEHGELWVATPQGSWQRVEPLVAFPDCSFGKDHSAESAAFRESTLGQVEQLLREAQSHLPLADDAGWSLKESLRQVLDAATGVSCFSDPVGRHTLQAAADAFSRQETSLEQVLEVAREWGRTRATVAWQEQRPVAGLGTQACVARSAGRQSAAALLAA